jgi:stage II sporulation protein D
MVLVLALLLLGGTGPGQADLTTEPIPLPTPVDVGTWPEVRVLLHRVTSSVTVRSTEEISVEEEGQEPRRIREVLLPPEDRSAPEESRVWVLHGSAPLELEGRAYRGRMEVHLERGGLLVVNRVGLEDYLRGVVPRELLSSQLEAVKAQAVLARTYALAHLKEPTALWDVRDDVGHQVYGGVTAEHPISDQAVFETAGLVLGWRGSLASRVVFHSTCGGCTEGNENVFGTPPVPYLRPVSCLDQSGQPACAASSYSTWTLEASARELGQEVGRMLGKPPLAIRALEIRQTSPSGRVMRLALLLEGEEELELQGADLRRILRLRDSSGQVRNLPSTRFLVESDCGDGRIRLRGSGWGHGVGMCQWGAMGLAREGWRFEEILDRYYPGTQVLGIAQAWAGAPP